MVPRNHLFRNARLLANPPHYLRFLLRDFFRDGADGNKRRALEVLDILVCVDNPGGGAESLISGLLDDNRRPVGSGFADGFGLIAWIHRLTSGERRESGLLAIGERSGHCRVMRIWRSKVATRIRLIAATNNAARRSNRQLAARWPIYARVAITDRRSTLGQCLAVRMRHWRLAQSKRLIIGVGVGLPIKSRSQRRQLIVRDLHVGRSVAKGYCRRVSLANNSAGGAGK